MEEQEEISMPTGAKIGLMIIAIILIFGLILALKRNENADKQAEYTILMDTFRELYQDINDKESRRFDAVMAGDTLDARIYNKSIDSLTSALEHYKSMADSILKANPQLKP